MAKQQNKQISVTLVRSPFGAQPRHRACVRGLGLRKMHQTVVLDDTPAVRGMLNKVEYMVRVTDV